MPKRSRPAVKQTSAGNGTTAKPAPKHQAAPVKKASEEEEEEDVSSPSSSGSGAESDSDSEPIVSTDEEGDQDDADADDEDTYDDINVEFEFFDPKEADFLGLKALLHTFLDGQAFDSSGLVNAVISQTAVGTVVKTSEEDDPIAVMTLLNTRSCKGQAWMAELRAFLASHCPSAEQRKLLAEAFDKQGTGLLLNERLLNSPPSMGPPLVHFLFDELEGAAEDEDSTPAEREEFQMQRFLLCTRAFTDPQAGSGPSSSAAAAKGKGGQAEDAGASGSRRGGKKAKKQQQQDNTQHESEDNSDSLVYMRPEDEFLHHHATWSFTFPVEGRPVAKGDLQPLRLVMCVPASKIPAARRELDRVVGNMATA